MDGAWLGGCYWATNDNESSVGRAHTGTHKNRPQALPGHSRKAEGTVETRNEKQAHLQIEESKGKQVAAEAGHLRIDIFLSHPYMVHGDPWPASPVPRFRRQPTGRTPSLAHAVEKCIARVGAIGNEWLVSHGCDQDAAKVGWAGQDRDGCHGVSQDSTLACCAALSTSTRSQSGGCCQWVLPAAEPCMHDASQGRTASSQSDGGRRAGVAGRGCTNMHEGGVRTGKFKKRSNSRNRFVGGRASARQERGSHSSPSHTCRRRF